MLKPFSNCLVIFFKKIFTQSFYLTIFKFISDCTGLHCCVWAFPSSCAQASHCCGFSCCGAWALERVGFSSCSWWAIEHRLGSCSAQAYLPCSMWNFPSRDWTHVPALAGRFLTTGPPGKSMPCYLLRE